MKYSENPFSYHYEPKVNVSKPLDPETVYYYQSLIEIMQWMIELGCIEIATEVSMLSFHNAYPHEVHFIAYLLIMY